MKTKTFKFNVNGTPVVVEAEEEGAARFMLRMFIPGRMARIRIGYLTGTRRTWLAEFFGGNRPSKPTTNARQACRDLAVWASAQPTVLPFLGI